MTVQGIANNQMSSAMLRMSTGQRINSAADDAAGLAISEKLTSQVKGLSQNVNNVADANNLLRTAEGALGSIGDSLTRMRELAVQASNGTLTEGDRSIIQTEITALKEGISSVVQNTEFNTMKLLDGNFRNKNVAMNPSGSGSKMTIENTGLETLGIKDFDVRGEFDISDIDNALLKVTESRSKIGSATNAFEHASRNINNGIINQMAANSRIQDADYALEISDFKKNQVKEAYALQLQKMTMNNDLNNSGMMINQLL